MSDQAIGSRYHATLRILRHGMMGALVLSAVVSLLMLTGSVYMLQVYDRVLSSGSVPTLVSLFAIVVMLYLFLAVYDGLRMRLLSRLALRFDADLAPVAFAADLGNRCRGKRDANLTADVETLRAMIAGPATLAILDLPFTVVFVAILFLLHPVLGWLTVGGMVLAAAIALANRMVLSGPLAEAHGLDLQQRRLTEATRSAAPTIAALGMTSAMTARWTALHDHRLARQQAGHEPSEMLAALSRALRMLLQSALLTAAAWLVLGGAITAGAIVASSILAGRALAPVDQLIAQWRSISAARASHVRMAEARLDDAAPRIGLPALTGMLEVRNLTKLAESPGAGSEPARILDRVSFSLAPGEGLGIVGTSASGKSTLARLIAGALHPDSGEVRFDGATAMQWHPDELGRQIGYLPQRVDLLPGTVRDNIARFSADADDGAVIAAAQAAGIHDSILRLPQGYATDLGSVDVPLSGGQIQRIGLARALYGDPRILILDEPNAHLDLEGEAALVQCIATRRKAGVTVIVLAHRAGALAAVDRLMVLRDGQIVQDGPRDEVMNLIVDQRIATTAPRTPPKLTIRRLKDDPPEPESAAPPLVFRPRHPRGQEVSA